MISEKDVVLNKMKAGFMLFGNEGDYGRPFRLLAWRDANTTWEDVDASVANELLRDGLIEAVDQQGNEKEYRPVRR